MKTFNFSKFVLLVVGAVLPIAASAQYRELPHLDPLPPLRQPLVVLPPPPPPRPPVRPLEIPPVRLPVCHDDSLTWTDANGVRHVQTLRRCD